MAEDTLKALARRYGLLAELLENGAGISGLTHVVAVRHSHMFIYAGNFEAAKAALRCAEAVGASGNATTKAMEKIAAKYVSMVFSEVSK